MAYRKTWNVCLPLLPGDDEALLLWLLRESAENKAASYMLKVIEFTDLGVVPVADISPLGIKQLGPDYKDATFREFRVVAEREAVDASGA